MEYAKRALLALCSAAFAAVVVICSYLTVVYPSYVVLWILVVPVSVIASLGMLRLAIRWKDRAEL